jgi:hypothetical protein
MKKQITRRSFIESGILASAAVTLNAQAVEEPAPAAKPELSKNVLPKGKIGKLEVSRLILGGNLLTHYTHSRDLQYVYSLAAHYNSDEKILETLAVAEANGINTLTIHNPPHSMGLLRKYRKERGGKIQWIICPTAPVNPGLKEYRADVESLIKDGCEAIYLWGVHADALVSQGKLDLLAQAVALAKEYGVPSGVGGHDLRVIKACEEKSVPADFYIKTFHHHQYPSAPKKDQLAAPYNEVPGYWCQNPEETAEFMETVKKPWIAFKTMAAGAIPPKSAFQHSFANGADYVLAGMFDFEIAEDAKLAMNAFQENRDRPRPWRT